MPCVLRQSFCNWVQSVFSHTQKIQVSEVSEINVVLLWSFLRRYSEEGQWDGSMGKDGCLQAWRPSSIPRTHMVKGKNQLSKVTPCLPHACLGAFVCTHIFYKLSGIFRANNMAQQRKPGDLRSIPRRQVKVELHCPLTCTHAPELVNKVKEFGFCFLFVNSYLLRTTLLWVGTDVGCY